MKYSILFFTFLFLSFTTDSISQQKTDTTWNNWQFLMGNREGENSGQPGVGTAYFSFNLQLDSNILYRADHNEFLASENRPAFHHDGILIIYKESSDVPNKAVYFDNEGHSIYYTKIDYPELNKSIILTSSTIKGAPVFKLSFLLIEEGKLKINFEISQPDNPDNFISHVEGIAVKKK